MNDRSLLKFQQPSSDRTHPTVTEQEFAIDSILECSVEQFRTLTHVSALLGIPLFKLRRAAKSGALRTYSIGNRRILVRLSEVVAAIENSSGEKSHG